MIQHSAKVFSTKYSLSTDPQKFLPLIPAVRCCFLISAGEEERDRERFISELENFIAQLLKMVEVELKFNYETLSKISGQVHGKVECHLSASLDVLKQLSYFMIDHHFSVCLLFITLCANQDSVQCRIN